MVHKSFPDRWPCQMCSPINWAACFCTLKWLLFCYYLQSKKPIEQWSIFAGYQVIFKGIKACQELFRNGDKKWNAVMNQSFCSIVGGTKVWGVQWRLPIGQCFNQGLELTIVSHFDNWQDYLDTLETPLLSLQVFRANSPAYFPLLPLVSLFATCVSSSAAAPCLCPHHPEGIL